MPRMVPSSTTPSNGTPMESAHDHFVFVLVKKMYLSLHTFEINNIIVFKSQLKNSSGKFFFQHRSINTGIIQYRYRYDRIIMRISADIN